jgi:ribosomal protein S27E
LGYTQESNFWDYECGECGKKINLHFETAEDEIYCPLCQRSEVEEGFLGLRERLRGSL